MSELLGFNLDDRAEEELPPCDMCRCSNCGWFGSCDECETEQEQDGWESPPYGLHLCPVCEDGGCIDDYFHSDAILLGHESET